jgi:hypothetical protein
MMRRSAFVGETMVIDWGKERRSAAPSVSRNYKAGHRLSKPFLGRVANRRTLETRRDTFRTRTNAQGPCGRMSHRANLSFARSFDTLARASLGRTLASKQVRLRASASLTSESRMHGVDAQWVVFVSSGPLAASTRGRSAIGPACALEEREARDVRPAPDWRAALARSHSPETRARLGNARATSQGPGCKPIATLVGWD